MSSVDLRQRLDAYERRLRLLEAELVELRSAVVGDAVTWEPTPRREDAWEMPPAAPEPAPVEQPPVFDLTPGLLDRAIEWLGRQSAARILAWAGGIVTALGIVLFFALAVNRGWIGPEARVAAGGLASALVLLSGLWLHRRFGPVYSAFAAVGAGIAGAYATLLAAVALYELLPQPAALLVAAGIASIGLATSLAWRSELVAGLGLIGAILVPVAVVLDHDGLSFVGTAFAALVLVAAGIVATRLRWDRLAVAAALASAPQIVALVAQGDVAVAQLTALAAFFSVTYLAVGVARQRLSGSGLAGLSA
jgi:uncharacterized membrane protein